MPILLILFISIPFIELALLVKLGEQIGFWPTILLQIGTGIAGATLARWQGWWVWKKVQLDLAQGRMPAADMIDGILILLAGLVMLTPGLLTDAIGFLLLIPPTRLIFKAWLVGRFERKVTGHQTIVIR